MQDVYINTRTGKILKKFPVERVMRRHAHPAPSFDGGIAMSFYRWVLKKHINTMAPVGDLARDMKEDSEFPRDGGKKKIRQYLEDCHACSGCMDAFDEAWAEYARERS